jgi:hypothetical protein
MRSFLRWLDYQSLEDTGLDSLVIALLVLGFIFGVSGLLVLIT